MAHPEGRPPKVVFDKRTLKLIRDWAAQGMYDKHIAAKLGYSRTHFAELKRTNPDISDALAAGNADGIDAATKSLMDEIKSRNMTATIFYLKAKAGWRDNAPFSDDDGATGDSATVGRRVLDAVRVVRGKRTRSGSEGGTD